MALRNDESRFGTVSIALHWLAAVTVLTMLFTGLMMALAPNHAAYLPWVKFHGSFGMTLWLLLAVRIIWHFVERKPQRLSDNPALNRLASTVHVAMLLLIGWQLVSGPMDIWSGGFPLSVFGWFAVPSPVGHALDAAHDKIGTVHGLVGLTVALLLALHLSGVAKHVLIDRDGTLGRMLGRTPR